MTFTPADAAERVANGAAYLDRIEGTDWHTRVDLATLDLTSQCKCVLGQLMVAREPGPSSDSPFGLWIEGRVDSHTRLGPERIEWYGFDAPYDLATPPSESFALLQDAWRDLITERLAVDNPTTTTSERTWVCFRSFCTPGSPCHPLTCGYEDLPLADSPTTHQP